MYETKAYLYNHNLLSKYGYLELDRIVGIICNFNKAVRGFS